MAVWEKPSSTVEKYLHLLPYERAYREDIGARLGALTATDFSGNFKDLYPLFPVFPKGAYEVKFIPGWDSRPVAYAEEGCTRSMYRDNYNIVYATQSKAELNMERVKYYEEKIRQGEQPFAIVFKQVLDLKERNERGYIERPYESETFVVDGHHKLMAYQHLDLNPAIVEFTFYPKSQEEVAFEVDALIDNIAEWEAGNIIQQIIRKERFIGKYMDNPLSKVQQFLPTGFQKQYYDNGRLKFDAFFRYGELHGECKSWHENGRLESIFGYKNGRFHGMYKEWYEDGSLKNTAHWKNGARCGDDVTLHPDGKIESIQGFNSIGQQHGRSVYFDAEGRKLSESWYHEGNHPDGCTYNMWHKNGHKKVEIWFENGDQRVVREWDSNGTLTAWRERENGSWDWVRKIG